MLAAMRASGRPLVAAILLLAAGTLPACSEATPAAKAPRRSATSTATSSPTPTKLTPEQEVEATIRAYFATANEMFRTGDVESLRRFSVENCPCRKITNDVEEVVRRGGHYDGSKYVVRRVSVHDVAAASAAAEVVADVPPYKVFAGSGQVLEDSGGGKLHTDFSLVKKGDRWIITNAVNLE